MISVTFGYFVKKRTLGPVLDMQNLHIQLGSYREPKNHSQEGQVRRKGEGLLHGIGREGSRFSEDASMVLYRTLSHSRAWLRIEHGDAAERGLLIPISLKLKVGLPRSVK